MNWIENIAKLLLSILLGGIIGFERETMAKPAGLRTNMILSLVSCLIAIVSLHGFPDADKARLAAYLLAGIGFIGGGTILKERGKVIGLTTAASLLVTVGVGIAVGAGFYVEAFVVSLLTYIILRLGRVEKEVIRRSF